MEFKNVDSCSNNQQPALKYSWHFLFKLAWETFLYAKVLRKFSWPWEFEDCPLYAERWRELLRKEPVEILIFSTLIISKIGILLVKVFLFCFHWFCCSFPTVHQHSKMKFIETQTGGSPASFHICQGYLIVLALAWEILNYVGFLVSTRPSFEFLGCWGCSVSNTL